METKQSFNPSNIPYPTTHQLWRDTADPTTTLLNDDDEGREGYWSLEDLSMLVTFFHLHLHLHHQLFSFLRLYSSCIGLVSWWWSARQLPNRETTRRSKQTGIARRAISIVGSSANAIPSATLIDMAVWKNSGITLTWLAQLRRQT